jgi:hypothetical protein
VSSTSLPLQSRSQVPLCLSDGAMPSTTSLPPRWAAAAVPLPGAAELNLFITGDTSSPWRAEHSRHLLSRRGVAPPLLSPIELSHSQRPPPPTTPSQSKRCADVHLSPVSSAAPSSFLGAAFSRSSSPSPLCLSPTKAPPCRQAPSSHGVGTVQRRNDFRFCTCPLSNFENS